MSNKLTHVLVTRAGDREKVIEYLTKYNQMGKKELIDAYNSAWKTGIVGAHAQGLSYFALHRTFEKVFGKSPITLEDNILLSLTHPIFQKDDSWEYSDIINYN